MVEEAIASGLALPEERLAARKQVAEALETLQYAGVVSEESGRFFRLPRLDDAGAIEVVGQRILSSTPAGEERDAAYLFLLLIKRAVERNQCSAAVVGAKTLFEVTGLIGPKGTMREKKRLETQGEVMSPSDVARALLAEPEARELIEAELERDRSRLDSDD